MKSYSEYAAELAVALKEVSLPVERYPDLYGPVVYALDCGGKRLRPVLMLMVCEAVGGEESAAMQAAVGIEMFHNFTLLHDDIMDDSPLRRGRDTVCKKWGVNAAILSGDAMLTLATGYVANVSDAALRPVLECFNRGALDVYEGQSLDMEYEERDSVTVDEYIRMVGLKTGALLATAARIGAIIGGASDRTAQAFYDFAYNLGLAFQIHDDYLDVYGDAATFGKPIGGDINNGKKTFLMSTAFDMEGAHRDALRAAMQIEPGSRRVRTVTKIFDGLMMPELCRKACNMYCSRSLKALKQAEISDEWREAFRRLAAKLTDRKK